MLESNRVNMFFKSISWAITVRIFSIVFAAVLVLDDASAVERSGHSALEDIQLLHKLHQAGALTKDEFAEIKKEILSTIARPTFYGPTPTERANELVEQWFDEAFQYIDLSDKEKREIRSMVSYVADERDGVPVIRDVVAGKLGEVWIEIDEIVVRDSQLIEQDIEIHNIELHLNPVVVAEIQQKTGISLDEVHANITLKTSCENNICKTSNQLDLPGFFSVKGSSLVGGERILRAILNNLEYLDDDEAVGAIVASLTLHEVNYEIADLGVIQRLFQLLEEKLGLNRAMIRDRAAIILQEISLMKEAGKITEVKGNNKAEIEQALLSNIDIASQAIQWVFGEPDKIVISIKPEKPMSLLSMWLTTVASDGDNLGEWVDIEFVGIPSSIEERSQMEHLHQHIVDQAIEDWISLHKMTPYQLQSEALIRGQELYAIYCSQCHGDDLLTTVGEDKHSYLEVKAGMRHADSRQENQLLELLNTLLEAGEKDALAMYLHWLWEQENYPDEAVVLMQQGMRLIKEKTAPDEAIALLKKSVELGYPEAAINLSNIYRFGIDSVEKKAKERRIQKMLREEMMLEEADLESEQITNSRRESDSQKLAQLRATIRQQIERVWNRPKSAPKDSSCRVKVTLVPGGHVGKVTVVSRSGNEAFDLSVVQAVNRAAPFPVPGSAALRRELRELEMTFEN